MGTPTTVGVDDDLTAGKTSITLGTTDDEKTRGLDLKGIMSACAFSYENRNRKVGQKAGKAYVVNGALIE